VRRTLRGAGIVIASFILLFTIAGATYEFYERARTREAYPPVGRMIDIGGRSLQLDCRGAGTPIVVFESGRDLNGSLSWYRVQDEVASFSRACSYSRAGILWSDPTAGPHTGEAEAVDLHLALEKAGERPPYVLVGHSAGGINVLIYTRKFGTEVAGLVLVDASHPEQWVRLKNELGMDPPSPSPFLRVVKSLAWTGLVRLTSPKPDPAAPKAMRTIAAYTPTSLAGALDEMASDAETFKAADGAKAIVGTRPLYVLTAGMPPPDVPADFEAVWQKLQNEEVTWSPNSEHQVLADSHHYIQLEQPERVVGAVRWTVDRLRQTPMGRER
jgi:pimeloyl-ACP methyl ester carboxylesterase